MELTFEFLYPCGMIIRPANPTSVYPLSMVDMQKVRTLALTCSPVALRGFSNTKDRRMFIAKAHDLGPVLPWKSGVIQEVKDESNDDPQSNSGKSYSGPLCSPCILYQIASGLLSS